MAKQSWKPGNMLYPVPAVLVSCRDKEGKDNVLTIAWAGTICSDPAMLSISVRKERYSYPMIKESGEFVVNLTTKALVEATDYCGVKSGKDEDKFAAMNLTKGEAEKINAPIIMESPVNIECKVKQVLELGSHDMFIAEVVNVQVSEELLDEKGSFKLQDAELLAYSHGEYYELGNKLGTFGFSVKKK
ncbi:MAG: flavin reductase family protein [Clostridiales bacterium]|nr:flavin reductase family protein [Clostridiales bacterium]